MSKINRPHGEKETRLAMKKFSLAVQQSPNITIITDTKGLIEYVNGTFCRITGYRNEDVLSKNPRLLKSGEHSPAFYKELWQTILRGETWKNELINRKKDGTIYWEQASIYPLYDDGRITHFIKVSEDITNKKLHEKKLKEREFQYKTLVDQASDGIFQMDLNGQILDINSAACEMLGYSSEELEKWNLVDLMVMDTENPYPIHWDMLKQGKIIQIERPVKSKDGTVIPVEIRAKILPNGIVQGIIRDETDRINAEIQMQKDLKEKEVLLKEIHHRVKNNLQIIISLLNLQSHHLRDKETLHAFKESKNRIRSISMVHEKLYRSKNFSNIDFKEYAETLIQELCRLYQGDASVTIENQIQYIALDLDRAVPCGLILNELVSNAIKHAFRDREQGKITIRFYTENNETVFIVRDNGNGMHKIPDMVQSDTLGLKLVGILTEQLGGTVQIELDRGTRFIIRFPDV
ncbi:PAS domain S-box protein [bacterium]|nr:PAS domain S-box protein [bacterium]